MNHNDDDEYHYHIEDGQFSYDFTANRLLGKEGQVVEAITGRTDDLESIYILYVDGNYVECIGDVEREFPRNKEEHDRVKNHMLRMHSEYGGD